MKARRAIKFFFVCEMGATATKRNPDGTTTTMSWADAFKEAEERRKKRYEVPEGKTLDEYKALAQKFSGKYKELVEAVNKNLDSLNVANYKARTENVRRIANKEGFEHADILIGGSDDLLVRKNEQICTLIVVIVVLITAFILLGCYMLMHGGASTGGTNRNITDNTYRP